jgi:hypothetical protein
MMKQLTTAERLIAAILMRHAIRKTQPAALSLARVFIQAGGTTAVLDEIIEARTRWTTKPSITQIERDLRRDQAHWTRVQTDHRHMLVHEMRGNLRELIEAIDDVHRHRDYPREVRLPVMAKYQEVLASARRAVETVT